MKSGLGSVVLRYISCPIGHCQEKDSEAVQLVLSQTVLLCRATTIYCMSLCHDIKEP